MTITVSTPVTVTVSDSQGAPTVTASFSATCAVTLPGVGSGLGVVTVTARGAHSGRHIRLGDLKLNGPRRFVAGKQPAKSRLNPRKKRLYKGPEYRSK